MIPSPDGSRSWLSRALTLLGVAVVAFFVWRDTPPQDDAWVTVFAALSLACWVATVFVPRQLTAVQIALTAVMVLSGAAAVVPSNGVLVVTVAVGLVLTVVDLARPLWHGLALGVVAAAVVPLSALSAPITPLGILSIEAGIVVALLAGLSRRQFRASEKQARQLLEERVAAREELARATVLAARQQVARDIHDVLAHSLGGLVIQLDAVDALLEAGRTADAAGRVRDARELAVSGLAEARRAVDALRDVGEADVPPSGGPSRHTVGELVSELLALADAHRALGGTVEVTVIGADQPSQSARSLGADAAFALRRAFQESLTNARKHAPGLPVTAELRLATEGALELRVENPLPLAVPSAASTSLTPAGHGLEGMAERFAAVPGGSVRAGEVDGHFVVLVRLETS
ncbi:sensor histidine kinase [Herbiconiux sp. UC225_62]|uniref:sensor histidine kinase n=1 Tax=Herbiconiux sp. UC225_62 TaxID=3350168 RepID=UPI0036D41786